MKRLTFFFFFLGLCASSQNIKLLNKSLQKSKDSINYNIEKEDWKKTLQKAKKEDKYIVLYLYIENWKKDMKRGKMILKQDDVQSFFKKKNKFISKAYNTNHKGLLGKTLGSKYEVLLPTFVFLNADGILLNKISLKKICDQAEDFRQAGKVFINEGKKSITKGRETSLLIEKFIKKTIDSTEIKQLVNNTLYNFLYRDIYGETYVKYLHPKKYLEKENIPALCRIGAKNKKVYTFLTKNAKYVRQKYGDIFFVNHYFTMYFYKYGNTLMERSNKVYDLFNNKNTKGQFFDVQIEGFFGQKSTPQIKKMQEAALKDLQENSSLIISKINFLAMELHQKPIEKSFKYLDNYCNSSEELVYYANYTYTMYLKTKNTIYKEKAMQWIKKSIKIHENFYNLYSLYILQKGVIGKNDKLIRRIKQAAKKEKLDVAIVN